MDTCDDLYRVAKGLPEGQLTRETLPQTRLPGDIARELAPMDDNEVSTGLTRGNALVFLMLCKRSATEALDAAKLTAAAKEMMGPKDTLATVGDYYHGAFFYGGERVLIAKNWGELEFGRKLAKDADRWFLPQDEDLLRRMKAGGKFYCISEDGSYRRFAIRAHDDYGIRLKLLKRVGDKVLYVNQEK